MEDVLAVYAQEYQADFPVVCFDERPCFLIGDAVKGLEMKSGQPAKQHYAYTKHGCCQLLLAIEPKTGRRIAHVYKQRRMEEYADFMAKVEQAYPDAEKIRIVQDNLSTHKKGAFYNHFPASKARRLAERLEFHFTPKGASWLNMAEIEFSALARGCLNRRIPSQEELTEQVLAFIHEREEKAIKINWQFSIEKARETLGKDYLGVNPKSI